jgi:hypothetical protein
MDENTFSIARPTPGAIVNRVLLFWVRNNEKSAGCRNALPPPVEKG